MLVLRLGSLMVTWRLKHRPDRRQAAIEAIITGVMGQIEEVIGKDAGPFLPLIGTLFIFLAAANLSGVLPGVEAPTGKKNERNRRQELQSIRKPLAK
jgi:F-type H+-transporting ATPase subunit a